MVWTEITRAKYCRDGAAVCKRYHRRRVGDDCALHARQEPARPAARDGDAGKKIKGRKRRLLTDIAGFLIAGIVHEAGVQDSDGAPALLQLIRSSFPWLRHVFADGGYASPKLKKALASIGRWTIEIVNRSDAAKIASVKLLARSLARA